MPLEKLDLRLVQIMYTTGDMAAIRGLSPYDYDIGVTAMAVADQPVINDQVRAHVWVFVGVGVHGHSGCW